MAMRSLETDYLIVGAGATVDESKSRRQSCAERFGLTCRFWNCTTTVRSVAEWSFLTNHARVVLCIAHDPGVRLRDIGAALEITERSAFGIVNDLVEAGYVLKERDGRRNRYQIQHHLPLDEASGRERTIGELVALLAKPTHRRKRPAGRKPRSARGGSVDGRN